MIGWHISVYRQARGGDAPARADSRPGSRLAVWQTGGGGLAWIDELVTEGHAVALGGNGYPLHYTAQCEQLLPAIESGPPSANEIWAHEPGDIIDLKKWHGKTTLDQGAIDGCAAGEWLLIEAWDES